MDPQSLLSSLNRMPPDWPGRSLSSVVTVGPIQWHVQQQGIGPTVLLVHGTGGSTHSWAEITKRLSAEYHVVAIDLPGHGFTTLTDAASRAGAAFALPAIAKALGELLRTLTIRPTLAVGHSAGTPILMQMALNGEIAPDHLLGVCPALVAPPAWYVQLIAPMLAPIVESSALSVGAASAARVLPLVRTMLKSTGSQLTAEQLRRYEWLCQQPEHVHAAMAMMARWDLPTLIRESAALRTPLTLLAGRRDRWVPLPALRRAAALLPTAALVDVGGGHLLPEEFPDEVVARIARS